MNARLQYIRDVRRVEGVVAVAVVAVGLAGCGSESNYANKPRPPAPISVTAAIDTHRVRVSRPAFGGGPVTFIISNQSGATQKLTFESEELGASKGGMRRTTNAIPSRSTGQLTVDPDEGAYTLRASSGGVAPAPIKVGPQRRSSQNDLLLP